MVEKRKVRAKRSFSATPVLKPTEYELNLVNNGLTEFYKNNPQFIKNGESIEEKIKTIVDECQTGWICAPKNFIKRVEWKTKWNSTGLKTRLDYRENYFNAEQINLQKDLKKTKDLYPGISANTLRNVLPPEERKFWQEREAFYRKEFEFNNSSDWSLLMQLLLEELTQYRLARRRMQNPDEDLEFPLSESYKRLINAQKSLGITREQRENASNETEGNIAQLAVRYEEKVKIISKLEEKDRLEEEAMQIRHDNGDGLKLLPDDLALAMSKISDDSFIDIEDLMKTEQEDDGNQEDPA